MKPILVETLATITQEREKGFDRSFQLVDPIVRVYGENSLAERLYAEIATDVSWEVVADLFGILIWSTSDNGAALTRQTEEWLRRGDDLRAIRIALHLDVYPFLDRAEMERVLGQVAARHPAVAECCREMIASRRALPK